MVVSEPTEYKEGEEARFCTVCDQKIESRAIEKLASSEPEDSKVTETQEKTKRETEQETERDKDSSQDQSNDTPSGCNGTIGAGAIMMLISALLCCVLFDKKKKI